MNKYLFFHLAILFQVLLYTNISAQWVTQNSGVTADLKSVFFPSLEKGFAVANNKILRTTDGGINWNTTVLHYASVFESVFFINEQLGWVVGTNGYYANGVVSKTTDGGLSWSPEQLILGPSDLNSVYFVNQNIGYVAGLFYAGSEAIVGKTTDGGTNWEVLPIPYIPDNELYSIFFVDENLGWTVGDGWILKTTNGGNDWFNQSQPSGNCVYFISPLKGWITNGYGILRTIDGGNNWISNNFSNELLRSIHFVDDNNGYAVGLNGEIQRSSDGGITWIAEESSTTNDLLSVNFPGTSTNIGWAVGSGGAIIKREQFTEQTSISLTGVFGSSIAWGDYDNDGDLDLLLTGYAGISGGPVSIIYRNEGNNTFVEQTSIILTDVSGGFVAWGDYDNDGDLDILLTGYTGSTRVSKIYRNEGSNTFVEQTSINLTGVNGSSVAWGDYDNDGKLDILLTGFNGSNRVSKLYHNEGNNIFIKFLFTNPCLII